MDGTVCSCIPRLVMIQFSEQVSIERKLFMEQKKFERDFHSGWSLYVCILSDCKDHLCSFSFLFASLWVFMKVGNVFESPAQIALAKVIPVPSSVDDGLMCSFRAADLVLHVELACSAESEGDTEIVF